MEHVVVLVSVSEDKKGLSCINAQCGMWVVTALLATKSVYMIRVTTAIKATVTHSYRILCPIREHIWRMSTFSSEQNE